VRNAAGSEHPLVSKRFVPKMEAVVGRDQGSPVWGAYAGARYLFGRPGGLFARYDVYDPDRDASGNLWRRLALGWWKDLNPHLRITAEYDLVNNEREPSDDTYGRQVQGRF
jgi:hypothetical protein